MTQNLISEPDLLSNIYVLLRQLGAAANYVGFFHTSLAVYLAALQPDRLQLVTKWLYPDVAKYYNTNWKAVERNIRYTVSSVWSQNPDRLSELAGFQLLNKPCSSKFLKILSEYCVQWTVQPGAANGICAPEKFPLDNRPRQVYDTLKQYRKPMM